MFIRLGNTLVNLDLIKELSEVEAHFYTDDSENLYHSKDYWLDLKPMSSKEEVETIARIATEPDYTYKVMYCMSIHYLNEKYAKVVMLGFDRIEARKIREEFATLLNNNNSIIPYLKIQNYGTKV